MQWKIKDNIIFTVIRPIENLMHEYHKFYFMFYDCNFHKFSNPGGMVYMIST